jgi:sulfide:quinone oxidoreductase
MKRVLILGGGVGGTRVANGLRKRRKGLDITVVDSHGDHLYQPSLLYLPFGVEYEFSREERGFLHPDIKLMVERVCGIDPVGRRVEFESGSSLSYDVLVIATGSRLDHGSIPGLREAGHHFHCRRSAERLRDTLAGFRGGSIVIGISRLPCKCPYSPAEFALLLHEWLEKRNLRAETTISFSLPGTLSEILGPVGEPVAGMFRERGIQILDTVEPKWVDPSGKVLHGTGGQEIPFTLLVMVPPHIGAPFLEKSGLAGEGNWVHTDSRTLQVKGVEGIFALGDATDLPLPKLGAIAHFQSGFVVENVLAALQSLPPAAEYDGTLRHFFETGGLHAINIESSYDREPKVSKPSIVANQQKVLLHRHYFKLVPRAMI